MMARTTLGTAPAFELADPGGRRIRFVPDAPGFKVLVFYKNSCPTCQFAMPYFDRLYTRSKGARVHAVSQDTPQEAKDFAREYDLSMPQLVDPHPHAVSRLYNIMNVPTLLVVDATGAIVLWSPAFVKADLLEAWSLLHPESGSRPLFGPLEAIPELKPG